MASDDRPTPRQIRRPLPGIPHDPRRESDTPYPPPRIERRDTLRAPTMPQEAPGQPSVSPAADAALGRLVRHGLAKALPYLVTVVTGAGGGHLATERAMAPKLEALSSRTGELERTLADTREQLAVARTDRQAMRTWASEFQSWILALEESRGVRVRQPAGAPPLPTLETTTPIRPPGRITTSPTTTVQTPPPSPP